MRLTGVCISLLILTLFIPGCCSLPGCFYYAYHYDGPYEGRVVDAETGEPIEGAVVLGIWKTFTPTVAGAVHQFHDAEERVTDMDGEFRFRGQGIEIFSLMDDMRVQIIKNGYEPLPYMHWHSLKDGLGMKHFATWEGDFPTIYLKKSNESEMEINFSKFAPPSSVPNEKIPVYVREYKNIKNKYFYIKERNKK